MAFPTEAATDALTDVRRAMRDLRTRAEGASALTAAAPVSAAFVLAVRQDLYHYRARIMSAAAVPGIADRARAEYADTELDIVAEFNAVIDAVDGTLGWIEANFPQDGDGYLLAEKFAAGGGTTARTFAAAATAGLRTQLATITGAID